MADQKISQLSSGTNAQAGDLFVIARGASNFNLTTAQLFNAPSAAATFASLTVDTDTLFVDAANNRVGIKQATPLHPVHVGTTDLILNTSGNLGLGVTPSAWVSTWKAIQGNAGGSFGVASGGNGMYVLSNAYYNTSGVPIYTTASFATMYQQVNGAHLFHTAPAWNGTGSDTITFTEAMTLTASGNLGLGATSPSVNGIDVVKSGGAAAYVRTSDGTYAMLSGVAPSLGGALVGTTSNHPVLLYANNAERARITAAGSVVAGASAALATTATDGFLYVPTCAGTPTGTPTAITGMSPIIVDTTNHKLYFRSGGVWRDAGP